MSESDRAQREGSRRIRLDTLVGLRWIAIGGQTVSILVVWLWLAFPLPVALCFGLTAVSAWLNIFLTIRYPSNLRLRDTPAALFLAYDTVQLGGLLFLTGGLQNPFAPLLVVPVIVSATALPLAHTVALGGVTVLVTSLLWPFHLPLPWAPDAITALPSLYMGAVWISIIAASAFAAVYTFRVATEARKLAHALAATELVLEREHHLSELDGLAAAAAHELGTPLATITLVARELQKEVGPDSPHASDAALLVSQSIRCREILSRLTSLGTDLDWSHGRRGVTHLLAEAIEPYADGDVEVTIATGQKDGPEPQDRRNPATLYGISNLIENAVDFARNRVEITASWSEALVTIEIVDDGPGFAPEVIDRIGEPYVTTRAPRPDRETPDHEAGGMGLGFFIAKTFLERSGARVRLSNRPPPDSGAIVRITWPRALYGSRSDESDKIGGNAGFGSEGDSTYMTKEETTGWEPARARIRHVRNRK